jgi:hypothetical protein
MTWMIKLQHIEEEEKNANERLITFIYEKYSS